MIELLQPVFGTAHAMLPVHTTGRGAMEAAICNLFSPGDAIAVCCNGKFGEMWATFARIVRPRRASLLPPTGSTTWISTELDQLLAEHRDIRAVALAYGDTSTGVANDVAGAARIARARDALVLVDGVSSIGGMPFRFDEWDVDVAITASQKCLMSSPGLAFAVLSDRAWAANATARLAAKLLELCRDPARASRSRSPRRRERRRCTSSCRWRKRCACMHEEGLGECLPATRADGRSWRDTRHRRVRARAAMSGAAQSLERRSPRSRCHPSCRRRACGMDSRRAAS